MSASLAEKLDLWGFEEETLIFKDCSLGAILDVTPRDVTCATDQELNLLHSASCDFLNGLPAGISLQFVQIVGRGGEPKLSQHGAANEGTSEPCELANRLTLSRVKRLRNLDESGDLPKQKLYLVIRRPFFRTKPQKKKKGSFFSLRRVQPEDWSRDILLPELQLFSKLLREVQSGLESLGIASHKLPPGEIYPLLYDQWNPGREIGPGHFNEEDIRDDLILSDLVMSVKGFSLGAVHHRVVSLKIMPDQTFASMSEKLRALPFDSRLFLSIETLNQSKETFALETQRRIAYALYAGKKGVSDLNNQAKLQDIEALLAKRVAGEEKIFSASLTIVLRHEHEETLDEQVAKVLQAIRELSGAEGMTESLASAPVFLELSLPNARSRERARRMNTSVLADFLPILGEWQGHDNPRVLLRTRSSGLIGFDPFSPELTNYNQVVSGGSGAGKSFMTNILISHLMKENPQIFILDIGGSYKKITENLGGQYIALGADSRISINPFDLAATDIQNRDEAIDQKIKFVTSLVELMTKEEGATGIGKLERSEIERMIQAVLRDETQPSLSHLQSRLLSSQEQSLSRMGKILGPWCGDAPFGKFMDRPTNLELTKRIVCFDLKGLESKPDLQAVCLFLITDLIWREVQRDRTNQKIVVFDECWKIIENEAGARFIGEVFRTFRKYLASAIAISQTMDDFGKSKVAQAILPNAAIKWILRQTGGNLPSLREMLVLNEREMRLVESVTSKKGQYSEAFLIAGDHRQVVLIESTPLEYWLATTDSQDLKLYFEEQAQHSDLSDGEILERLASRYPHGAAGEKR